MSESVAVVGTVAVAAAGPPSRPPLPGETRQRRGTAPAGSSSAETVPETPATARHAAESAGRFRARIHTETVRVIAEIVDMTTGDVLIYLSPGYRQSDDGRPQVLKRVRTHIDAVSGSARRRSCPRRNAAISGGGNALEYAPQARQPPAVADRPGHHRNRTPAEPAPGRRGQPVRTATESDNLCLFSQFYTSGRATPAQPETPQP